METKIKVSPRARIEMLGAAYRGQLDALKESLKEADKASYGGNLSRFVATLEDVGRKASAFSKTADQLSRQLAQHGKEAAQ